MKKKLVIVGAGGTGCEIVEIVTAINKLSPTWEMIGFLDDDESLHGRLVGGLRVFGGIEKCVDFPDAFFVSSIGHPEKRLLRKQVRERMAVPDDRFATLVHPHTAVSVSTQIGAGTVVCGGCVLGANSKIGRSAFLTYGTTVGHDSVVGNFTVLASGVNVSGEVTIGDNVYIGAGTVTKHGIVIGNNVLVGIGSLVIRDIPDNKKLIQSHRTFVVPDDGI